MNPLSAADVAGRLLLIDDDMLSSVLTLCVDHLASDVWHIDLRTTHQPSDAMNVLAQRAQFPDYFGGNLDALYDVLSERLTSELLFNQTWLIRSTRAQEKLLFPILDTLRDAMSEATHSNLSIVWWING